MSDPDDETLPDPHDLNPDFFNDGFESLLDRIISAMGEQKSQERAPSNKSEEVAAQVEEMSEVLEELLYTSPFLEQRLYQNKSLVSTVPAPLFVSNHVEETPKWLESAATTLRSVPINDRIHIDSIVTDRLAQTNGLAKPVGDRVEIILRTIHSIHDAIVNAAKVARYKLSKSCHLKNELEASIVHYLLLHERELADIGCLFQMAPGINSINAIRFYCDLNANLDRRMLIVVKDEECMAEFSENNPDVIPLFEHDGLAEDDDGTFTITFSEWIAMIEEGKAKFYTTMLYNVPLDDESFEQMKRITDESILKMGKIVVFADSFPTDLSMITVIGRLVFRHFLEDGRIFDFENSMEAIIDVYSHRFGFVFEDGSLTPTQRFVNALTYNPRIRRRIVPEVLFHPFWKIEEDYKQSLLKNALPIIQESQRLKRRICFVAIPFVFDVTDCLAKFNLKHANADSPEYLNDSSTIGIVTSNAPKPLIADDIFVFDKFDPSIAAFLNQHIDITTGIFDIRVFFMHHKTEGVLIDELRENFNEFSTLPPQLHDYDDQVPYVSAECNPFDCWNNDIGVVTQLTNLTFPARVFSNSPPKLCHGKRKHCEIDRYKEVREYVNPPPTPSPPDDITTEDETTKSIPCSPDARFPLPTMPKRAQPTTPSAVPQYPPLQPTQDSIFRVPELPLRFRPINTKVIYAQLDACIPSFRTGFSQSAPFGMVSKYGSMRRLRNLFNIDPLVRYYLAKEMEKYYLFGSYFYMMHCDGKFYKSKSPYFNWESIGLHFNNFFHPSSGVMHRIVLNKMLMGAFIKPIMLRFSLNIDRRFVCHNRRYQRDLQAHCSPFLLPYDFDAHMQKHALTVEEDGPVSTSLMYLPESVFFEEVKLGVEPAPEGYDDFWTDMLAHQLKPCETERTFIPVESFKRYFKMEPPIDFAKYFYRRTAKLNKDAIYVDDGDSRDATIDNEMADVNPSDEYEPIFRRERPEDIDCESDLDDFFAAAFVGPEVIEVVAGPDVFEVVHPENDELVKAVPLPESCPDVEEPRVPEAAVTPPPEPSYANPETIGPYRKLPRVPMITTSELSTDCCDFKLYPADDPPRINFTDLFSDEADDFNASKFYARRKLSDASVSPEAETSNPPSTCLTIPTQSTVSKPPPYDPIKVVLEKGFPLDIIGAEQSKPSHPTIPALKRFDTPITRAAKKECSPEVVRVIRPKLPRLTIPQSSVSQTAATNPISTKESSPDIIVVGEVKAPKKDLDVVVVVERKRCIPVFNALKRVRPTPLFVIPKKRAKRVPRVQITRSIKYYPPSPAPIPRFWSKLLKNGKKRLHMNFKLPRVPLQLKWDTNAFRAINFAPVLRHCPRLRKLFIRRLHLVLKKTDSNKTTVADASSTKPSPVIAHNLPKVLKEPPHEVNAWPFNIRDQLLQTFMLRANHNPKRRHHGVRWGDTSVMLVYPQKRMILQKSMKAIPVSGVRPSDLTYLVNVERTVIEEQRASMRSQLSRPGTTNIRYVPVQNIQVSRTAQRPPANPPARPQVSEWLTRRMRPWSHLSDYHFKHDPFPVREFTRPIDDTKKMPMIANPLAEVSSLLKKDGIVVKNVSHTHDKHEASIAPIFKNWNHWPKLPATQLSSTISLEEAIVTALLKYRCRRRFVHKRIKRKYSTFYHEMVQRKFKIKVPSQRFVPPVGRILGNLKHVRVVGKDRSIVRSLMRRNLIYRVSNSAIRAIVNSLRQCGLPMRPWHLYSMEKLKAVMTQFKKSCQPTTLRSMGFGVKYPMNQPTRLAPRRRRSNSFAGSTSTPRLKLLPTSVDDIALPSNVTSMDFSTFRANIDSIRAKLKLTQTPMPHKFVFKSTMPMFKCRAVDKPSRKAVATRLPKVVIDRGFLNISRTYGPSPFMLRHKQKRRHAQTSRPMKDIPNQFAESNFIDIFNHDFV